MKVTYYVAKSLDDFIAREDGDVSWLDDLGINMEETGYDAFFESIDALVMGRDTYDFVYNFGSWPYGDKPTWVCTRREIIPLEGANMQTASTPGRVVEEAKTLGINHLWLVGGGQLASSFLEANLLTHLSISEMPVRLGSGIPLFARHSLTTMPLEKAESFQKKGFRQWEIELPVEGRG